VCTFAQHGALAALQMDPSIVTGRRDILQQRRDRAAELTRALFPCVTAQGAFYLFVDVRSHLQPGHSSMDLAARLLDAAGVAVVPGEAFHGPGRIRLSFGMPEPILARAFEKMKEVL
ncbi:MAG: aminotransferase class I/II-fold pyridoxal phosphate-dependent enzyme, partial [Desulfatitalea sp.]|nr:aminotransferase class I/II-fold pyridoxal phosphate-dependent enzyme [Desulfatitalea sp.]NNK01907.1 aminotransferase class I/II-fold pyridoxal phosphate-dependent enzyme [Desulfatitalea sp.]